MFAIVSALPGALVAAFRPRASLVAEILVLRQQLAVLKRQRPRPPLRPIDRAFWVLVSRVWSRWADALAVVKPANVIAWHRCGFGRFWAYKSRPRGRSPLSAEVIELIERMTRENPTWSRRRIAAELAKLGHDVSKDTVAKYMPKRPSAPRRPPSTTWGTFLRPHLAGTIAIDLLTVPTVTFNVLYVFFVLSLERRRILHVNVTAHPHAAWASLCRLFHCAWKGRRSESANSGSVKSFSARPALDVLRSIFPWWEIGKGARYALARALVHMWMDVPWRVPVDAAERPLLRRVDTLLTQARAEDSSLNLPLVEWAELRGHMGEKSPYSMLRVEMAAPGTLGVLDVTFRNAGDLALATRIASTLKHGRD